MNEKVFFFFVFFLVFCSVRTLIDTMKTTIAFEKELNKRFEGKAGSSVSAAAALRSEMRYCAFAFFPFFKRRNFSSFSEVLLKSKSLHWLSRMQSRILSGFAVLLVISPFSLVVQSPEALKLKWKKFQEEKAALPAEEAVAPSTRFTKIIRYF